MSLAKLRDQLVEDGCSKPDQVMVLISACIESGIDQGPEIVSTISGLGFDKQHVGLLLSKSSGLNPGRHHWKRNPDGHYQVN